MSARATDQSGITGSVPGATGHWHDGSWYTNDECKCALSQPTPEQASEQ